MDDPELQVRARRLDANAVAALLNAFYPVVYRLALTLTGERDSGERVARAIMQRAMHRLPAWKNAGDPQRWFHHHTVLLTRRISAQIDPMQDVLVAAKTQPSPQYVAFVRAIRHLPAQAREAIILHDAEQLDARAMAVAMDCSTEAASNHLAAGRRELLPAAGEDLNRLLAELRQAYQSLIPQESIALPLVRKLVRRHVWPRRAWTVVRFILTVAIIAAIAWFAWVYVPILDW